MANDEYAAGGGSAPLAASEAHQEWAISTLSKAEVPDFFDYFTDGKWQNRTETDPWGENCRSGRRMTISVEKDGIKKVITGVNPGPK